jgi:hypothetical protein
MLFAMFLSQIKKPPGGWLLFSWRQGGSAFRLDLGSFKFLLFDLRSSAQICG